MRFKVHPLIRILTRTRDRLLYAVQFQNYLFQSHDAILHQDSRRKKKRFPGNPDLNHKSSCCSKRSQMQRKVIILPICVRSILTCRCLFKCRATCHFLKFAPQTKPGSKQYPYCTHRGRVYISLTLRGERGVSDMLTNVNKGEGGHDHVNVSKGY